MEKNAKWLKLNIKKKILTQSQSVDIVMHGLAYLHHRISDHNIVCETLVIPQEAVCNRFTNFELNRVLLKQVKELHELVHTEERIKVGDVDEHLGNDGLQLRVETLEDAVGLHVFHNVAEKSVNLFFSKVL